MKIKLDENLPIALVTALKDLGHDIDTVQSEGLAGADDDRIWRATQTAERFLITQDLDFSDTRQFAPGTHAGIMLVRLHEPSRRALISKVQTVFATEDTAEWNGCFIVATDHKVRIRKP